MLWTKRRSEQTLSGEFQCFANFMADQLYGPEGYYSGGHAVIGENFLGSCADFTTSPEIHPIFNVCLANCVEGMWNGLGRPGQFDIFEMGAGNGTMAKGILETVAAKNSKLMSALNYHIVEIAPGMARKQQKTLNGFDVTWHNQSATDIHFTDIVGGFISNELVDAFPVHRLMKVGGEVVEIAVRCENDTIRKTTQTPCAAIADSFYTSPSLLLDEGVEFTANNLARQWQHNLARSLERGYVATIDYGNFGPTHSREASVPRQYPPSDDGSFIPGRTDITTDVNFEALQQAGNEAGLHKIYSGKQHEFLDMLGYWEELKKMKLMSRKYSALADLRHELGKFIALVQAKKAPSFLPT